MHINRNNICECVDYIELIYLMVTFTEIDPVCLTIDLYLKCSMTNFDALDGYIAGLLEMNQRKENIHFGFIEHLSAINESLLEHI